MNNKDMMILSIDTPMDGNDEIICLYSLEHKGPPRSRMGAQGYRCVRMRIQGTPLCSKNLLFIIDEHNR